MSPELQLSSLSQVDISESQLVAVLGLLTLPILGFVFHPAVAEAVRAHKIPTV